MNEVETDRVWPLIVLGYEQVRGVGAWEREEDGAVDILTSDENYPDVDASDSNYSPEWFIELGGQAARKYGECRVEEAIAVYREALERDCDALCDAREEVEDDEQGGDDGEDRE